MMEQTVSNRIQRILFHLTDSKYERVGLVAGSIKRVALVTGANQGIGFEIASQLLSNPDIIVYIGARDPIKGNDAIQKLNSNRAKFLQLDILNDESINIAAQYFKDTHAGLDILINNAGILDLTLSEEVAKKTCATNYFGTKKLTEAFIPLLLENGRIVFISSQLGGLKLIKDPQLRDRINALLTPPQVDHIANEFISAVKNNIENAKKWHRLPHVESYGVSKTCLNSYTQYLIRNSDTLFKPGVKVYSVCPGRCATNLTDYDGRSPALGAETPVWLALLPPNTEVKPQFYYDKKPINW